MVHSSARGCRHSAAAATARARGRSIRTSGGWLTLRNAAARFFHYLRLEVSLKPPRQPLVASKYTARSVCVIDVEEAVAAWAVLRLRSSRGVETTPVSFRGYMKSNSKSNTYRWNDITSRLYRNVYRQKGSVLRCREKDRASTDVSDCKPERDWVVMGVLMSRWVRQWVVSVFPNSAASCWERRADAAAGQLWSACSGHGR
jgi:hypothetical protein